MKFNNLIGQENKIQNITKSINSGNNIVFKGLSQTRFIYVFSNFVEKINGCILLIAYDNVHVNRYYEDLIRLLPKERVMIYPETEILPHEQIVEDLHETGQRIKVLQALTQQKNKIIITTIETLFRKLIPVEIFKQNRLILKHGREYNMKDLSSHLITAGYQRLPMVEDSGQFSIRGGILDVFTLSNSKPFRIEFFGDEIDSIRQFDAATQLSDDRFDKVVIPPASEIIINQDKIEQSLRQIRADFNRGITKLKQLKKTEEAEYLTEKKKESIEKLEQLNEFPGYEQFLPYFYLHLDSFLDYFPEDTHIFMDQAEKVLHRIKNYEREIAETQATLLEQGSILPTYSENFLTSHQLISKFKKIVGGYVLPEHKQIQFVNYYDEYKFKTRAVEPFHGKVELLKESVENYINENYKVIITLNSTSKAKRIAEFLLENGLNAVAESDIYKSGQVNVITGSLFEGFVLEDFKIVVFAEKEVFGKPQKKRRQLKEMDQGVKISSLNELSVGDYVVHENHGIGKYLGVKTMKVQEKHKDYLVLKYAGEDKLYVPTVQVNLVQKYIGADQNPPKLYKLGGSEWKKVKQKVQNSVKEMAIGLLELYAERETVEGFSFSEDTVWQKEFEEAFPYEETPDQLTAIEEVKTDMEDNTPMDRLLCGDVGYGKTEVAIRAAFKAVMDGKQTAVLVPTTILAQQHYNTFVERMENYPINIEMISRFKTAKEQRQILKKLAIGEVDIIIGTHRLLSKDIVFHELGLLIVDEEQRFGVTHKERLKDFKTNVDVLTLTATPIPRTLHMALVGVRDMSVIETPPENRFPIRTYIREFNKELIRDAIRKEIGRGGQVYFVHNRVEDIDKKADMIRKLIPESRVAIGHGQMNEKRLEKLMFNFYNNQYDVLVCTTIIETGLDLPNVNTIIINKADQMGLAQLYQLRGRVGRSNRVAYAYLLYEKDRILPEVAEKRLRAIKEFTNLGSGFKIAMRDLEIRGAGNLLGPEQHGHIASIGFSLYCKLLENAVEELKGKEKDANKKVEIKLNIDAYLPDDFIPHSKQKIEIYKKIMSIKSENDYSDILDEVIDRFGSPPKEAVNLIDISLIKLKARKMGIYKVLQENGIINCYFNNAGEVDGKVIFDLIETYKSKIKIKSGRVPVLGITTKDINFLHQVLDKFIELSSSRV
ncbi:MAG: transcription-repair coupling factor [Halothermotrichaceae bacterium]